MHYDNTKLIRMAKQMADFFRNQPDVSAPEAVAEHINTFWAPDMRREFVDLIASGAQADPVVRDSAAFVRLPAA